MKSTKKATPVKETQDKSKQLKSKKFKLDKRTTLILLAILLLAVAGFMVINNKKYESSNNQEHSNMVTDANGRKYQVLDYTSNESNSGTNQKNTGSIEDQIKKLENTSTEISDVSVFGQPKEYAEQDKQIALAQLYYQSGNPSKAIEHLNKAKGYAPKNSKNYESTIKYIDDFIKKLQG